MPDKVDPGEVILLLEGDHDIPDPGRRNVVIMFVTILQVDLDNRIVGMSRQLVVESHLSLGRNSRQDNIIWRRDSGRNQVPHHLNLGVVAAWHPMDKDGGHVVTGGGRALDGRPVLLDRTDNRRPGHQEATQGQL